VGLLPVDLRLVDLRLVDLCLVGRMVLLVVPHKWIVLARAFLFPGVGSIQMGHELFYQYLLRLVDLVDLGLWLGIAPCRHRLRDP
jgi:hypothetical protein